MKSKQYIFIAFILLSLPLNLSAQITIEAGAELTIEDGATMTAEGNVDNAGTVSGKGTLNVAGNFSTTGTFAITIGPDQFTHTTLDVTGDLTIGGDFTVTNKSYTPISGDEATIITSGNAIGTNFLNADNNTWFANYNMPASGDFTISYSMALPVELIRFSGQPFFDDIILEWETASELNNKGFDIQHSENGRDWKQIGFVNGEGTSARIIKYEYRDEEATPGINYYRLKQINSDGQFEYSKVISVLINKEKKVEVYPNPAIQRFEIIGIDKGEIIISDKVGRIIIHAELTGSAIDISELPPGVYFIQISLGSNLITKKLIKV